MDEILFSIIIPTYNRAGFIHRAVSSILSQTYPRFELLIIDDGSSDNTREVVMQFQDPRVSYHYKENGERAAARNFGVLKAKGDYVTFLDSDDLLKPNHLKVAYDFIHSKSYPAVFHVGYNIVSPAGKVLTKFKRLPDPVNEKLLEGNFLSCIGIFGKREIFIENKFNETRDLSGAGEDYELWLRIAARYPIRTCPEVTGELVNHGGRGVLNVTKEDLQMHSERLKNFWSNDEVLMNRFKSDLPKLHAYLDLYTALHLSMIKSKRLALEKLVNCVGYHPRVICNYRFWVVVKKLVLG
jgi:glycosyltransferase involved in cell wall biosynthesis